VLYVLYGGDDLAIRRRMTQLKEASVGSGAQDSMGSNLTQLDGRDATPEAILAAAMTVPFLAERRLVVAASLVDRFNSSHGKSMIEALSPLLSVLEKGELPETTDLILIGGHVQGRNALLDRIKRIPDAALEEYRPPQKDDLTRWIRSEARDRGITWRTGYSRDRSTQRVGNRPEVSDPVGLLALRFQSDTLALSGELDKLALYTMGREVTVEDVDLVCGGERESRIFDFVDALMDGDLPKALAALDYLRRSGGNSQAMLGLLGASYRRLAPIIDHLAAGSSREEIGKAIGLPWRNLRDKAIARAERHQIEGILVAYELIIKCDRRIKLGEIDEDLAIDTLALRLSRLAPLRRSRRPAS